MEVGTGIFQNLESKILKITCGYCKIVVITDDIVDKLYFNKIYKQFENSFFEIFKFVFKSGEASKNLKNYKDILEFLSNKRISKSDVILALGGGVVGDLAGFIASTYLRGIKFINIPTTLLAAVDASIGGKNGVNLINGKNLVGSFWQPNLVLIDLNMFSTLNSLEISNGISEIIKYATIYDYKFFKFIESNDIMKNLEKVIRDCVKIKLRFINLDEYDESERQKLNFGHTLGHAIEKCSNYKIPHGRAVAIGMACITRAAAKIGVCDYKTYLRLVKLLKKYNLPFECKFDLSSVYKAILNDKKKTFDIINLILINKIGNSIFYPCRIKNGNLLDLVKIAINRN